MLALTKRTEYALIALHFIITQELAAPQPAPGKAAEPVSAREVAERFNVPLGLLMNVLKKLASEHVLISVRGPKGGYILAPSVKQMSLARLIEAVEGPISLVECACDADGELKPDIGCALAHTCPIRRPLKNLHMKMMDFLSNTSVYELCATPEETPLTQLSMASAN